MAFDYSTQRGAFRREQVNPTRFYERRGSLTLPDRPSSFCSPANLDASANYINILLTTYGYPVPLNFKSNDPIDACKVVNCLYQVLKDKKVQTMTL